MAADAVGTHAGIPVDAPETCGAAELLRPFQKRAPALEYFARNGWNVNGRDAQGHTALHKATFLRYRKAVRTLLALGGGRGAFGTLIGP